MVLNNKIKKWKKSDFTVFQVDVFYLFNIWSLRVNIYLGLYIRIYKDCIPYISSD